MFGLRFSAVKPFEPPAKKPAILDTLVAVHTTTQRSAHAFNHVVLLQHVSNKALIADVLGAEAAASLVAPPANLHVSDLPMRPAAKATTFTHGNRTVRDLLCCGVVCCRCVVK